MMQEMRLNSPAVLAGLESFSRQVMASRPWNEVIERHKSPYIERWMLARKATIPRFVATRSRKDEAVIGSVVDDATPVPSEVENCYLHHYLRPDAEDMHCHPWHNATLVIFGGYVEEYQDMRGMRRVRHREAGDIVLRSADRAHAIVDVMPGTLSLFATLRKSKEWFFHPEGGEPVHHTEYSRWRRERGM